MSFPLCDITTNKRRRFRKATNQWARFKEAGLVFSSSAVTSIPLNRLIHLPTNIVSHWCRLCCLGPPRLSFSKNKKRTMAILTTLFAFLYHLPQVYKWLLKPYYITSLFMSVAFLLVRKTPGICEHLSTQREDGNSCDFDWVCIKQSFGV